MTAADTENVGAVLGIAQYWSSLVGVFLVAALIFLVKRWIAQLDSRAIHLDQCIDSLRKELQRYYDKVGSLEEWRKFKDKADDKRDVEWEELRRHTNRQTEIDADRRHELDNRIQALLNKVAALERAALPH